MTKLKKDDFVMHLTEGWFGVVTDVRDEDEEIYKVKVLNPNEFYRGSDLKQVSEGEIPFHIAQRAKVESPDD